MNFKNFSTKYAKLLFLTITLLIAYMYLTSDKGRHREEKKNFILIASIETGWSQETRMQFWSSTGVAISQVLEPSIALSQGLQSQDARIGSRASIQKQSF